MSLCCLIILRCPIPSLIWRNTTLRILLYQWALRVRNDCCTVCHAGCRYAVACEGQGSWRRKEVTELSRANGGKCYPQNIPWNTHKGKSLLNMKNMKNIDVPGFGGAVCSQHFRFPSKKTGLGRKLRWRMLIRMVCLALVQHLEYPRILKSWWLNWFILLVS